MNCQEMTLSLGVYVIGALDPVERAEVDAHLGSCPVCRAELAELDGLPALLDTLTLDDLAPEPVVPSDDLFQRVATQARAEQPDNSELTQRRNRYRRLTAIAAAFVLIVGGSVGGWALFRDHDNYQQTGPVKMTVSLAAQTTGTSYTVSVSGLPNDEHCKLIAVAKDGSRDVAGRWDATYAGQANETGSTIIPRSRLAKLVLLGDGGDRLAVVNV
jgi:predicted anti-sigma-YlaC factor YlaD